MLARCAFRWCRRSGRYGARFVYSHIIARGRHMFVSGGLGCSKVPLRLGVPPEIARLTLGA